MPHFQKPLPIAPARSLKEVKAIVELDRLVPAMLGAARDSMAYAERFHEIAKRYRSRLITEIAARHGWSRDIAAEFADKEVLG